MALGEKHRPDAAHLGIVRGILDDQEKGFAKAGGAGKADNCEQEKEKPAEGERVDAYENHNIYVF